MSKEPPQRFQALYNLFQVISVDHVLDVLVLLRVNKLLVAEGGEQGAKSVR
jgi:hypothetical protein